MLSVSQFFMVMTGGLLSGWRLGVIADKAKLGPMADLVA